MRFAITYSKQDPAGVNIANQLKKLAFSPQIPLIELKQKTINAEDLNEKNYPELKNIDFLVFASKHESAKKEHSLSLHAPGNWRAADYGGQVGKICNTSAFILKYLFQQLNENAKDLDYNITLECTHHGPLIDIPCCFIEIGSSPQQWNNEKAGEVIAKTILSLQNYKPDKEWIPTIGLGGPHYCPNFNKIQENSVYALSHIIPEYVLPLTSSMLSQAEQKTSEQIRQVIVDWKGCGKSEDRTKALELVEKSGLKYIRTSEVEK